MKKKVELNKALEDLHNTVLQVMFTLLDWILRKINWILGKLSRRCDDCD